MTSGVVDGLNNGSSSDATGALFSAVSEDFAFWYPRLWSPLGAVVAAVARPGIGERVLDACCGSGASALPAALAVGVTGSVDAVDLAEPLLDQGRSAATRADLRNIHFVRADATTWRPTDGRGYDLVQCGYGIFFFSDMDTGGAHLTSLLRPGGRLVASTWIVGGMDRIVRAARDAARAIRPEPTPEATTPDQRLRVNSAERLAAWLASIGLARVTVHTVDFRQPLVADDAWRFFIGAAPRRFLTEMNDEQIARVRDRFTADLAATDITRLDASSLIGVGWRG